MSNPISASPSNLSEPHVARLGERYLALGGELLCAIGADGVWLLATGALDVVLGYTRDDLREHPFESLLHPDDRASVDEQLAAIRAGARDVGFRCRARRRDGSYILVDWRCGPRDRAGLVLAVGRDVTNETLLHERLRASEARVRALSDSSPIGVYETDCRGSIVYANDRMQSIWDVAHSALADGSWIERVHPSDSARFVAWLEDPASRTSSQDGSFRLLGRDGAIRHVVIRSVPRLDGDGRVIGIVGTVEDVTERGMR
jgi:PAS domain S-box-containing protein